MSLFSPSDANAAPSFGAFFLTYFKNEGTLLSLNRGEFLELGFRELEYVYLIVHGVVRQYFTDAEGNERTILLSTPGDFYGEISVIRGDSNQVIAKAMTDAAARKIERGRFLTLIYSDPRVCQALLAQACSKVRSLMALIHDDTYFPVETRLLVLLWRLAAAHGEPAGHGVRLTLRLTHQDLATMVGSTRSTVTKILFSFRQRGLIEVRGHAIILLGTAPESLG